MAFDLIKTNLAEMAETGYEFEVKLPDGSSTDFFITVRGNLSPIVKKHGKELFNKDQTKQISDKRRGMGEQPINLDDMEQTLIDSAVVRIITWKGLEEDGKPVEFSKEAAQRVMTEHSWIREQVLEEGNNAANFI